MKCWLLTHHPNIGILEKQRVKSIHCLLMLIIIFKKKKHGGMFKSTGVAALLRYAPYKKVKHALKKVDAKLDKQAQQTWKNVNSYMGLRKSSKGSSGHVEKLLRFALKAPEEIRDEIFCQLCKQTEGNPSVDSLIKGWKLMAICCAIFPPSDEFANYLSSYLFSKTKEAGAVGQYATFALQSLDRTMEVGQRRIQPMELEIQRIEEKQSRKEGRGSKRIKHQYDTITSQ